MDARDRDGHNDCVSKRTLGHLVLRIVRIRDREGMPHRIHELSSGNCKKVEFLGTVVIDTDEMITKRHSLTHGLAVGVL
jgi:hypothetical protein